MLSKIKLPSISEKMTVPNKTHKEEELLKREVAKDPWEPRLKPVTDDNKTMGNMPAWVLRKHAIDNNSFID